MKEALEIINDLLETISWLGGDAYEQEAIESSVTKAYSFLEKHNYNNKDTITLEESTPIYYGFYCLKDNENKKVTAANKKHARNLLKTTMNNVKCLEPPKPKYMK